MQSLSEAEQRVEGSSASHSDSPDLTPHALTAGCPKRQGQCHLHHHSDKISGDQALPNQ